MGHGAAIFAAMVVALVALVLAAAPWVAVARAFESEAIHCMRRVPRALLSELFFSMKTGDVVLYAASPGSPVGLAATQAYFSHVGLVIETNSGLLVSESTGQALLIPPRHAEDEGVRMNFGADLVPALARFKHYPGNCYLMRLARRLDADAAARVKKEAEGLARRRHPYPTFSQIIGSVLLGRSAAAGPRHCFQHVAHLLDSAGLTPLDCDGQLSDASLLGVCTEICLLPGRRLRSDNLYEEPVQILYDIT